MKTVFHAGRGLTGLGRTTSTSSITSTSATSTSSSTMKSNVMRWLPPPINGLSGRQDEGPGGAEVLAATVKAVMEGQVVGVPTDTIYGVACLAQHPGAIKRLYDLKERNGQKPLAICVAEVRDIYKYCKVNVKEELLADIYPGPVTLVFERAPILSKDFNPSAPLVGVRIPDHDFMRRLCQMCVEPLALTSANISSNASCVTVHEFESLWPKLGVVVDDGPIVDQTRLGSTVVDMSVLGKYRIIRPGCALPFTVDVLQGKYGLCEDTAAG